MPHWTHGGIAHGPKPRDYSYHINKKARQLAIKSALSLKVLESNFIVVDNIALETYRTKSIITMLKALGAEGKALIVTATSDKVIYKSASNIPGVATAIATSLNTYDLLNYDKCIIAKDAVSIITDIYCQHSALPGQELEE